MSKQQLLQILEVAAQFPPPENASIDDLRGWFESINEQTPVPEMVAIERIQASPIGMDKLIPDQADDSKVIIYYHGGGFVFGSSRSHRVIAANLAKLTKIPVLVPDYRMAPDYPAPICHTDALAVYQWALDAGYEASSIALSGDSAGGNLTLSTAVAARDQGLPLPAALVMMSPALDFAGEGESHQTMRDAPLLTPELMGLFKTMYPGNALGIKSTLITPFYYSDLARLPPSLVHVGSWELLRSDSEAIVKKLQAAGVNAELTVFEDMCHSWQLYAPMLDEAMESIQQAGAFIRRYLY